MIEKLKNNNSNNKKKTKLISNKSTNRKESVPDCNDSNVAVTISAKEKISERKAQNTQNNSLPSDTSHIKDKKKSSQMLQCTQKDIKKSNVIQYKIDSTIQEVDKEIKIKSQEAINVCATDKLEKTEDIATIELNKKSKNFSTIQTDNKMKNIEKITKGLCDKINLAVNAIPSSSDSVGDKKINIIKNSGKGKQEAEGEESGFIIPEVLRKQGTATLCTSNAENTCPCNTMEDIQQISKKISYSDRKNWISVERMNELRKKAQDAIKYHKTFTIRGCFFSIRNALVARGWIEKLDIHRRHKMNGVCQVNYDDLTNTLPKRRPGETRRQYLIKCERNIMSRFLEHMPIDFLWTARKEKCDWIDQSKNPSMIINKFHSVPFTSKEGLCTQLRDFHWFYEENVSELNFPRCYNVWSPEELNEFIENFRITGSIGFLKYIVEKYRKTLDGYNEIFADNGKIPFTSIDFALRRCNEFIENCNHQDIDYDESSRIWDHDWDVFLTNHYILTHESAKIQIDPNRIIESIILTAENILENIKGVWPQYNLDGCLNIWIVKPANKCRGRGIHLMNNIRKILNLVNPSISTKSRFVVQKYIERPLIIHDTKFDIRQWFLVTCVQPLTIWMYKESYLRFSSQEYNLKNYHESVHLTNHAIQKKYSNGNRDERLPNENMWDCYTFQAYLRQIGQHEMWKERIYPGMKYAIIGTMLASQENMDRRLNTFELFGADFMITEDFYPWLIEINSSPDLGATTSVTARMCPQCLEDIIKVIIDRKHDIKADTGGFEMIYRQSIPPTPAYMGLNLFLKGKQISSKTFTTIRRERTMPSLFKQNYLSVVTPYSYYSTSSLIEKNLDNQKLNVIDFYDDTILLPYEDGDRQNMSFRKSSFSSCNILNSSNNNLTNFESNSIRQSIPSAPNNSKSPISPKLLSPFKTKINEKGSRRFSDSSQKAYQLTPRRRLLSCDPRMIKSSNQTQEYFVHSNNKKCEIKENNIECIGNKCSLDNLNVINDFDINNKISPRSTSLSNRKQLCELMYKSRSARMHKSETKNLKKSISSPSLHTTNNITTNNKSHSSVKKLKNSEKHNYSKNNNNNKEITKITAIKNSNKDYYSSNFNSAGISLRTWKSKQYKLWKESGNNNNLPIKLAKLTQCKNSSKGNIKNLGHSPKKQLCKSLSKKMTNDNFGRGFTGQ